jgi:ubiquinone biosynthesis protein UbiJ
MIQTMSALAGTAAMQRLTLLLNHVLSAEPVATGRLRAHAGRSIALEVHRWPAALPALPNVAFRVTPAGLLDWCSEPATQAPDLRVDIELANPALALLQALGGVRPKIEVAGDAAFAGDLNWVFDNLRWDVQDDLARIVGSGPAGEITRIGSAVAAALRQGARALGGLGGRGPLADGAPPPGPPAR